MKLRKLIGLLLIMLFTNLVWGQTTEKKPVQEKKKTPSTEQKKKKKGPSANTKKVKKVPLANNKKKILMKQRSNMQKKKLRTAVRKKQARRKKR